MNDALIVPRSGAVHGSHTRRRRRLPQAMQYNGFLNMPHVSLKLDSLFFGLHRPYLQATEIKGLLDMAHDRLVIRDDFENPPTTHSVVLSGVILLR